jgi:transcription elongation factor GreA
LENLEYAKSLGDLSENAEYHQTREDQGKLEERIAKIEKILQSSEVVSGKGPGGDTVGIGSKVVVKKEGGAQEEKTYTIVGSEEANMAEGKISNRSPFGEALFGKNKGDKVSFNTPNGTVDYKIISVS